MRAYRSMRRAVAAAGLTTVQIALVPTIRAQGGAEPASAPAATATPTVCGSTPNCAEATDFAAMITNFRTSDARGYKILDVIVRFRNKTAAATTGRPVPTPVKATPGAATTPAVGAPAANGTAKTMPGPSPTVARTQPVTTPPVATPRTVTTVRAGAAPTAAKKDTTHSVKPAKP